MKKRILKSSIVLVSLVALAIVVGSVSAFAADTFYYAEKTFGRNGFYAFAGTAQQVWDGKAWQPLYKNIPAVKVREKLFVLVDGHLAGINLTGTKKGNKISIDYHISETRKLVFEAWQVNIESGLPPAKSKAAVIKIVQTHGFNPAEAKAIAARLWK